MSRYNLEEEISKAVSSAVAQGARRISFAGQLPSLLNYCANFSNERLNLHKEKITTGHTMTCLAMASTFESVLKETKCKTLSVIGVGSIGRSSLILILEKGMKRLPKKIILCDFKKKKRENNSFCWRD